MKNLIALTCSILLACTTDNLRLERLDGDFSGDAHDAEDILPTVDISSAEANRACHAAEDCANPLVCTDGDCIPARNCKALLAARPGVPDGAYTIAPDGLPVTAWCDMTTAGGGWTALTNPVRGGLAPSLPGLTTTTEILAGGPPVCAAHATPFAANGWHGFRANACGDITFSMVIAYPDTLDASEVMFLATVQGQDTRKILINERPVKESALSDEYMKCAFWNASGAKVSPAKNKCWETSLNENPLIVDKKFAGPLRIEILAGPSCSPDCAHAAGFNVQKIFVR